MSRQKTNGKTIGEVEKLTGIPKRKLKYYIERGIISPSQKSESGYWLYSEEDIRRLRLVFLCRELKYSDSQIRALLDTPDICWQEELDRQIARLIEERSSADDRLFAAERIRFRSRTENGGRELPAALDGDAGVLMLEGPAFNPGRPFRKREEMEKAVFRAFYEALIAESGKGGLLDSREPQLTVSPEEPRAQAWIETLCGAIRERTGLMPEEVLFTLRLVRALGGTELLLDVMLEWNGAVRFLTEAVQIYCDQQN